MADLKPANENPWYVLATLYGEQEGEEVDWELHEKNRKVWNQFVSASFGESKREAFIDVGLAPPSPSSHHNLPKDLDALFASEYMRRNELDTFDQKRPQAREKVEFHGVEFTKRFIAKGMFFPNGLVLDGCCFHDALDLDEAGIVDDFSVIGCRFKCRLSGKSMASLGFFEFANSILEDVIDIRCATIRQDMYFEKNVVNSYCVGYDLHVGGDLNIGYNRMRGDALFRGAKIEGSCSFQNTLLRKNADFSEVLFEGKANFSGARFERIANFTTTRFNKTATFSEAEFAKSAVFNSAIFADYSYFVGTCFGSVGSEYDCRVHFDDAQFALPASFREARFKGRYPCFEGSLLHPKTVFTADDTCWPEKTQKLSSKNVGRARDSCAAIRHVLGQQGLPEDEHFFFRREMGFAGRVGSRWARVPYRLFGLVSDYGISIARPLLWLLALWVVPALIYLLGYAWTDVFAGRAWRMVEPFSFSFANIFKVFGFQRLYFGAEYMKELPMWMQGLSGLQTVLGFALLFFLALGLRQRFRLR